MGGRTRPYGSREQKSVPAVAECAGWLLPLRSMRMKSLGGADYDRNGIGGGLSLGCSPLQRTWGCRAFSTSPRSEGLRHARPRVLRHTEEMHSERQELSTRERLKGEGGATSVWSLDSSTLPITAITEEPQDIIYLGEKYRRATKQKTTSHSSMPCSLSQ